MAELLLSFTSLPRSELIATQFSHCPLKMVITARLGAYGRSFRWTSGVQALSALILRTAAWGRTDRGRHPDPPCLEGCRPSMAASLNDVVTSKPRWVEDVFGMEGGRAVLPRLIGRWNPDFNTCKKAPVRLWVECDALPPEQIRVQIDGRPVDDSRQLADLAADIALQWAGVDPSLPAPHRAEPPHSSALTLSPTTAPVGVQLRVLQDTIRIEIELDRDFDTFGPADEEALLGSIRALLNSTREIRVKGKRRGSVILALDLTPEEFEVLSAAVAQGKLAVFRATAVRPVAGKEAGEDRHSLLVPSCSAGDRTAAYNCPPDPGLLAESWTSDYTPSSEAKTLADVIAAVFATGVSPTTSGVILDLAAAGARPARSGGRLPPVIRPGEAFVVGACAVGARVATAVADLHAEGMFHGDLKPSNVVIGPDGTPHLVGFNSAGGGADPQPGRGARAYTAPELLDAVFSSVPGTTPDGLKTDVFSLGVILYELLTGRHPFHPGGILTLADLVNLAAAIRRGFLSFPTTVPQPVAAVIADCLTPNPAARPGSALVAAALTRFVQDRRVHGAGWRWHLGATAALVLVSTLALRMVPGKPSASGTETPAAPGLEAPDHPPETAEEFFARGRELLRAGDVSAAQADFVAAHKMSGDPWAIGFAAYCVALNGQPAVSAAMNRQAVQGGAASGEVFNNLGYALIQSNQLAEGILALDDALRISPGMQAGLYNRALARYRIGLATPKKTVDSRAANDVTAALAAGPPSADLHYDAARIYAVCSAGDPTLREKALGQIRAAIAAGKDPAMCRKEPVFQSYLAKDPEFAEACNTRRGVAPENARQLRLVEPHIP